MLIYFLFYLVFYSPFVFSLLPQQSYFGVQYAVYGGASFWLCLLLTPAIALLPFVAYRSFSLERYPTESDEARRQWRKEKADKPAVRFLGMNPMSSTRGSVRSGYAFSQEDKLNTKIHDSQQRRLKFKGRKAVDNCK